jgi:hypothetical protein
VDNYPILEVTAAVPLPPPEAGERLVINRCTGPDRHPTAAYVVWDSDVAVMRDVRLVWRPDLVKGTLASGDPGVVSCRNPRFGG